MIAPEDRVRQRIAEGGRITFAEFMEIALYWPGGYYSRPGRVAPEGDFYTSPSAHPAFGALICVQLRQMWEILDRPARYSVIEPGGGDGRLAEDIVSYARRLDQRFFGALRYVVADRAAPLSGGPREALRGSGLPFRGVTGCILSNELLDAFPVHRFVIQDGEVREIFIALSDGELAEEVGPPSTQAIAERLSRLPFTLVDGCRGEVNLGLDDWVGQAAISLDRGFVLTFDYGHPAETLYSDERRLGTLRAYRHHMPANLLGHVGQQDMTAHVDLTAYNRAMESAGLVRAGVATQRDFLYRLGLQSMVRGLRGEGLAQPEIDANRMAMLELARPEGLGGFVAMAHAKAVRSSGLTGFRDSDGGTGGPDLPVPLLGAGHMPLLAGKYPAAAAGIEGLFGDEGARSDSAATTGRCGPSR